MEVEAAVRASRCRVAYRVALQGVEFVGPHDDAEAEARAAGFDQHRNRAYRNASLPEAVRYTTWEPCLPKTVVDELAELAS